MHFREVVLDRSTALRFSLALEGLERIAARFRRVVFLLLSSFLSNLKKCARAILSKFERERERDRPFNVRVKKQAFLAVARRRRLVSRSEDLYPASIVSSRRERTRPSSPSWTSDPRPRPLPRLTLLFTERASVSRPKNRGLPTHEKERVFWENFRSRICRGSGRPRLSLPRRKPSVQRQFRISRGCIWPRVFREPRRCLVRANLSRDLNAPPPRPVSKTTLSQNSTRTSSHRYV